MRYHIYVLVSFIMYEISNFLNILVNLCYAEPWRFDRSCCKEEEVGKSQVTMD